MMLFVHDDHHHLLCIILVEKRRISVEVDTLPDENLCPLKVTSYLFNERLHTVQRVLDILIQLWVTRHLEK